MSGGIDTGYGDHFDDADKMVEGAPEGWDAEEERQDQACIATLMAQGHSEHCAMRQVWGDGECECANVAAGYDPYAWTRGHRSNMKDMQDLPTDDAADQPDAERSARG